MSACSRTAWCWQRCLAAAPGPYARRCVCFRRGPQYFWVLRGCTVAYLAVPSRSGPCVSTLPDCRVAEPSSPGKRSEAARARAHFGAEALRSGGRSIVTRRRTGRQEFGQAILRFCVGVQSVRTQGVLVDQGVRGRIPLEIGRVFASTTTVRSGRAVQ